MTLYISDESRERIEATTASFDMEAWLVAKQQAEFSRKGLNWILKHGDESIRNKYAKVFMNQIRLYESIIELMEDKRPEPDADPDFDRTPEI